MLNNYYCYQLVVIAIINVYSGYVLFISECEVATSL